jgi:L,D-transpeptidase catalytic domain
MTTCSKGACSSGAKPASGLPGEGSWVAATIGLVCLGSMIKPADAFPNDFFDRGDVHSRSQFNAVVILASSHRARRHTDSTTGAAAKDTATKETPKPPVGPLIIVVSIGSQQVTVYDDGAPIATAPISTGMPGHPTPVGIFSIIQKDRYHHSNIYSDAPMPYMQRITWSGVAMHEGVLPGHPASHGCIRLPHDFAVRLWGMTKMGVRVVVTPRDDVTPIEFDHPRLVALATRPAAPDVAASAEPAPAPLSGTSVTPLPASTSLASPSDLHEASETLGVPLGESGVSGVSPVPALEAVPPDQRPGDPRPTLVTIADSPSGLRVAPAAATPERPLKPGPVSVFVSRKLGKLFVRKGNEPIFDTPVKIAHPESPLGTYVFTAGQPTGDGSKLRWLAMLVANGGATAEPSRKAEEGRRKSRAVREIKSAPAPAISSASATEALDRIEIPPEALELISPLMTAGASLIVSDQGISNETGKGTDFVILVR